MIDLYFHGSPNSLKVALLLEELGAPYTMHVVDILSGDQHKPEFRAINPNGKVPALVDGDVVVFDSNAILLFLAEKHDRFLPRSPAGKGALYSWLMFVATGVGPYSGQAMHFTRYAPDPVPYARNRYVRETARHYEVLEQRLADRTFILGDDYTIADMALWGWALFYERFDPAGLDRFPSVRRWFDTVSARPAAGRALDLRSFKGKSDFDADALRVLFPQNEFSEVPNG